MMTKDTTSEVKLIDVTLFDKAQKFTRTYSFSPLKLVNHIKLLWLWMNRGITMEDHTGILGGEETVVEGFVTEYGTGFLVLIMGLQLRMW